MTLTKILNRLVTVGPEVINRFTKPGPHCVLASAVGQMALARFGVEAEAYPVAVIVCNQAWVDWRDSDYQGGVAEQQRRGAYLLSNTPDFKGQQFSTIKIAKPWDGHLVLRVRKANVLIDLDLGSFNRPQHNIVLPGGIVAPLSDEGFVSGTFTDNGITTTIGYAPLVAPYANDYLTSRDWAERDRFAEHVAELVRAMRG